MILLSNLFAFVFLSLVKRGKGGIWILFRKWNEAGQAVSTSLGASILHLLNGEEIEGVGEGRLLGQPR